MKILIIILLLGSCKQTEKKGLALIVSDSDKIIKLESMVSKLVADTVYKAKQIAALKKVDSLNTIAGKSVSAKLNLLAANFTKDSIYHWGAINKLQAVPSLSPKLNLLSISFFKDSIHQWEAINKVLPLIPKVASLGKDSVKQWVAIKKLQTTSPITQIPIIQADIKAIQSKNILQDNVNVTQSSLIEKLYDTIEVLKVFPSSDFTLDATGKFFFISKAGIDRIKAAISPPLP